MRYTSHRNEAGEAFYDEACRKGWEGIIAKDARAGHELKLQERPRGATEAGASREDAERVDIQPTSWSNVKALWGN